MSTYLRRYRAELARIVRDQVAGSFDASEPDFHRRVEVVTKRTVDALMKARAELHAELLKESRARKG